MRIETVRFGAIDAAEERAIHFPEGLPGFEGRRYLLIPDKDVPAVEWLQSIDEPEVVLLLIDPVLAVPNYAGEPKHAEIRAIQPEDRPNDAITCRVIARGGARPGELLLNLFAPIFMNLERRAAMQVPLVGSGYNVRQVWPLVPEPASQDQ